MITQEQREAFAKDMDKLQRKHGLAISSSLILNEIKDDTEENTEEEK